MKQARTLIGISVMWLALSMLTDGISALVLPAMVLNSAAEPTRAATLGLITLVGLIAGMFARPAAVKISNIMRPRWGRKGSIAAGLGLLLAALFLVGSSNSLITMAIGFTLVQVTIGMVKAAQGSFIPDLIPLRQRDTARGLKSLMKVGGTTLGFLLLGQLLKQGEPGPALGAIATFLIATCLIMIFLVREPEKPLPEMSQLSPALLRRNNAELLDLRRSRAFLWLIGSRFLFLMAIFGLGRFMLYFVIGHLGIDPMQAVEETGFLLAALVFMTFIFSVPANWATERFGRSTMMVFGALVSAGGTLLFRRIDSSIDILTYGALVAMGLAAFNSANWATAVEMAPQVESGRYLALLNHVGAAAAAVAGLFGLLVDGLNLISHGESGFNPLFVGMAAAFVGSAALFLMARRWVQQPRYAERIS